MGSKGTKRQSQSMIQDQWQEALQNQVTRHMSWRPLSNFSVCCVLNELFDGRHSCSFLLTYTSVCMPAPHPPLLSGTPRRLFSEILGPLGSFAVCGLVFLFGALCGTSYLIVCCCSLHIRFILLGSLLSLVQLLDLLRVFGREGTQPTKCLLMYLVQ